MALVDGKSVKILSIVFLKFCSAHFKMRLKGDLASSAASALCYMSFVPFKNILGTFLYNI